MNFIPVVSAALVLALLLSGCERTPAPYLVVTSDTHISVPEGRWPQTAGRFRQLLTELSPRPPERLFIIGDVIDNARYVADGGVRHGGVEQWQREVAVYRSLQSHLPKTIFGQTYGPGHDFIGPVKLSMMEQALGPRSGSFEWQGVHFIWLTVSHATFWHAASSPMAAMSDGDYEWLDAKLAQTSRAVLMFHVPVRTRDTFARGKRGQGGNKTIDPRDRLYQILHRHRDRLLALFHGHIHHPTQDDYQGIGVYICPFARAGCHCRVQIAGPALRVEPTNCGG